MYNDNGLHTSGQDTERMFKEIDMIRKKQIELATEHISLESMNEMSPPVLQASDDNTGEYKRNLDYFNKKEVALKNLMNKLDALGQIMNDFREAPDLNPHTMITQEITTAPTSPVESYRVTSISSMNDFTSTSDIQTPNTTTTQHTTIPILTFDQVL